MSHYCPACRIERNRARKAERARELREAERTARENVDRFVLLGMDQAYADRYHDTIDDVLDELRAGQAVTERTVPDRMPSGANSPAGPDEGFSTYFRDLGEDLDAHAAEVARHPWFAANPHWSVGIHDEHADLENLRAS